MRPFITALCLLFSLPVQAQHFNQAKADSLLDLLAQYHKAMGAVAIYKYDHLIYERGFGNAYEPQHYDSATVSANTPATIYRIGSVTKMFTTVMIFQLIEQGKLELDTKLSKYFPEVPNAADITIEQLLTHHSGLHNFTEDADFDKIQYQTMTEADMLNLFRQQQPDFKPGTKGAYSNTNFVLLGYIVEKVTGMDYCTTLKRNITDRIHLKHTGCGGRIINKGEAASFSWADSSWTIMQESNMSIPGGAGCITSTVGDLAQFIRSLFDQRLVDAKSLSMMKAQVDNYGHGLFQMPFYGHIGYGHNGHIDNFTTSIAWFPDDSVIVSVACNALNYDFNNLLIGILSVYYNMDYSLPDFTRTRVSVSPDVLKSYEGVYTSKAIGISITIRVDDSGQITAQATNQGAFPLEADSQDSFSYDPAGIVIKFQQIANGHPKVLMLQQGGSTVPFEREP